MISFGIKQPYVSYQLPSSRGVAQFAETNFLLVLFQVKSRMMGDSVYKGTIDCFFKTLKTEVCIPFQF